MTGKTHKTAGVLIATGILLTTNIATAPLEIICFGAGCIYGALWPDIDAADYSKAKSAFVVSNFLFGALNGILRAFHIRKITSHRGITHSLFVPLITWYICHFLNTRPEFSLLFLGITLGLLSHIFLDVISGGANLFSPFINKRIGFYMIKTGGKAEKAYNVLQILTILAVFALKIKDVFIPVT